MGLMCVLGASLSGAPAAAGPDLFVGVTEDAARWRSAQTVAVARDLGLSAIRLTLAWHPGQTELADADAEQLDTVVTAAFGLRVVVTVAGPASSAPLKGPERDAYCAYVGSVVERYPTINDVVIWNEPNLGYFWQPQFAAGGVSAAPAAYAALLARCWDLLHAARPDVNLVTTTSPRGNDAPAAVSNISHSPGSFVRKVGAAYRASGRREPIFDTVGHNPYGSSSAEPPWQRHLAAAHVAQGDVDRLVDAYADGFRETSQPIPGRCVGAPPRCAAVWYLEAGYQTVPDEARRGSYHGRETDAQPVRDAGGITQSTQLQDGVRLAFCQPYVGGFFNFLLWDEPDLARWQSGVLWADGSRKAAYEALREVTAEVRARRTDCAAVRARAAARPTLPRGDALVERIEWTPETSFSSFNEVWWFGIGVRADSTYRGAILPLRSSRRPVMSVTGRLRRAHSRVVRFPPGTLRPGVYRIQVVVERQRAPRLTVTRRSPAFVVR